MTGLQMLKRAMVPEETSPVMTETRAATEHFDVLIVGAGLSGIAAACTLQLRLPRKSYAILEARDAIGGTWDLFRYPGVRSDSDMQTLGFGFRPWEGERAFTDGASIAQYIRDTAGEYDVERRIRFGCRMVSAAWSTPEARWTLEVDVAGERRRFTCGFLYLGTGYYDYEAGHLPSWPQMDTFGGTLVHPQQWPEDLDYDGKQVVVIGSGATAVTLIPELAKTAAHVTMLQRSPTYVVARPAKDEIARRLRRVLPARTAHALVRWKNVLFGIFFFGLARRRPDKVKASILRMAREHLGPDYDVDTHFNPAYAPWDQRVCVAPDADFFATLRSGRASIVTDHIARFTPSGLELKSGRALKADVVVAATGLNMKLAGGAQLVVDEVPIEISKTLIYKGMMLSGVPNLALAIGYTNASWTLKCELTANYACRLLARMDARGYAWCAPRNDAGSLEETPGLALTSGYVQRAQHLLPKQGPKAPWKTHQNYAKDLAALRFGKLEDGVMQFGRREAKAKAA